MPSHRTPPQIAYQTTVPSTQNHGFQVRARSERARDPYKHATIAAHRLRLYTNRHLLPVPNTVLQQDSPAYPKHELYAPGSTYEFLSRPLPRKHYSYLSPPSMYPSTQRARKQDNTQVVTRFRTSYVTVELVSPRPQRLTTRNVHTLESQALSFEKHGQGERMRDGEAEMERKLHATRASRPRPTLISPPGITAQNRDNEAATSKSLYSTHTARPDVAPAIPPGFTAADRDEEAAIKRSFYSIRNPRPDVAPVIPPSLIAQDRNDKAAIARRHHGPYTSLSPGFTGQGQDIEAVTNRAYYHLPAFLLGEK
ncbi:hypothetical protein BU16DRAFT_99876 [Lophium mytilinum]|uniref:Uncharacterized protein n=1 Tax=Lophium mytilinum TaxID=390894 RepID=A0A6A6QJY0_9PEZI|nr:hypothetical protein BU16DRAFT_99876 [Lophium mytilinum]